MADVKCDFRGLENLLKSVETIDTDSMCKDAVSQMGAVYLASAVRNTPTKGNQKVTIPNKEDLKKLKAKGKNIKTKTFTTSSEHMKRSWKLGEVEHIGDTYQVKVSNTASYASFVDKGHRQKPGRFVPILGKQLRKNFVKGLDITGKAEKAVDKARVKILKGVVAKYTKGVT